MLIYDKNRITDAINRGIKLGIDLYDSEFQDTSLDTDLQKLETSKQFKEFSPLKDLDLKIKYFLQGDKSNLFVFKNLCCNYIPSYYGIFKVKEANYRTQLHNLIKNLCNIFGPNINLNWIDVSNMTDMECLFTHTAFNGDISLWNVSKVENMHEMFYNSQFNGDISRWDVSNVKYMSLMFMHTPFNRDISQWDTSSCVSMILMFTSAINFNQDISSWNIDNVLSLYKMFLDCPINNKFKPVKHRRKA